ncbi:peptidoglycan/LPS O-acetylase OafA/YrhL [Catenibacillus scindens]|uniref:Peptidoglycan/LPS O-acetylase OafA/YrhL n=1 Tax=Catenibacillus scindens TaxID=673271 RepID=A0A7W8HBT0_9FIRM|nr:acyltransferase family protein [Catenibacillus scindens]MBB5264807.1 peptidoglycan/LPS O-acetylase OafA/YrhL [Catenibacillus scindens]
MGISRNESSILKGIAICMVIFAHILVIYFSANEYLGNILGTGGVCIFLILSGYGVCKSFLEKEITSTHWNNKIDKVFIPYWIVTLVC